MPGAEVQSASRRIEKSEPTKPAEALVQPKARPRAPEERTLAAWDARLAARLREALAAGGEVRFFLELARGRVRLLGLDDSGALRVSSRGIEMAVKWSALTPSDKQSLALALAARGGPEAHALAAFYRLAQGDEEGALDHLARAGEFAAEVRAAFR